jgi:hypothetical protein
MKQVTYFHALSPHITLDTDQMEQAVAQLVEVLRYKPEGRVSNLSAAL